MSPKRSTLKGNVIPINRREPVNHFLNPLKVLPHLAERIHKTCLPPQSAELLLSSACTFNCTFCSYAQRRQMWRTTLPYKIVEQCVDDFKQIGVESVYLSGGGEPTLVPYIAKLVSILPPLKVGLITAGPGIERLYDVADCLTYIQMSMHAATFETFHAITEMEEKHRQLVLQTPGVLQAIHGDRRPTVGLRFVICDQNVDEVVEAHDMARDYGFDYIIYRFVVDFEQRGLSFTHGKEYLRSLLGDREFDPRFTNLPMLLDEKPAYSEFPFPQCLATKLRFNCIIASTGDVYLCIPDVGNVEWTIGNIRRQSFRELWNGPQHQQVIQKLHQRYHAKRCVRCRFINANQEMERFLEANQEGEHALLEEWRGDFL